MHITNLSIVENGGFLADYMIYDVMVAGMYKSIFLSIHRLYGIKAQLKCKIWTCVARQDNVGTLAAKSLPFRHKVLIVRGAVHVRRQKSVPFAQFDCKRKTTLQNEAHLTGKKTKHELLIGQQPGCISVARSEQQKQLPKVTSYRIPLMQHCKALAC